MPGWVWAGTGAGSETEPGTESGAEPETESGTEPEARSGTESRAESGTKPGAEPKPGAEGPVSRISPCRLCRGV